MDVIINVMEKFIQKAINKYFKTLSMLGSVGKDDKYALFVVSVLYSMYKAFGVLFDKEGTEKLNKYVKCVTSNKCIFDKGVPCFTYNTLSQDSLITIIDSDVIATTSGNVMVSTDRTTQNFTDFIIRTDIQPDQFLVGYDRSDNNEMAINVNDLGVFWEVDI